MMEELEFTLVYQKCDGAANQYRDQFNKIKFVIFTGFENDRSGNMQQHTNNDRQDNIEIKMLKRMT